VFADLGFANPEEELTKAQIATEIIRAVKRRRLTQTEAAVLMGIDQPKVSALLNGRLRTSLASVRQLRETVTKVRRLRADLSRGDVSAARELISLFKSGPEMTVTGTSRNEVPDLGISRPSMKA
jgi:predicted XRE-type DNA-binding protein